MGSLTMANYEVEDVCDCKLSDKGNLLYKIKWVGYPSSENTWEKASNLDDEALRGSALPILLNSPLVDEIQGASLMRNLRKVASHITGMTIRSMRTSMNYSYNGTRERAHLLLLFSFWGNCHPARIINLKWSDVIEDQQNGTLILKVPGQNIILNKISCQLNDFCPVSAYQRFKSVFKRDEDDSEEEDEEIIDDFNFENIFHDSEPEKELKRLTSAWKRASKRIGLQKCDYIRATTPRDYHTLAKADNILP